MAEGTPLRPHLASNTQSSHSFRYVLGNSANDGGDLVRDGNGGVISVIIQYRLGVFGTYV